MNTIKNSQVNIESHRRGELERGHEHRCDKRQCHHANPKGARHLEPKQDRRIPRQDP